MKHSLHILDELVEANSTLAQAEKVNPFYLPVNYFADFPADMQALLFVNGIGNNNPYTVNSAYFESFPANVQASIFVNGIGNKNPFTVDSSYFESFPADIQASIFVNSIGNKNPFTVDNAYFKNFPQQILEKINETGSVSLPAKTLDKEVFQVPEFYFENLSDNILNKIKSAQAQKSEAQLELEEISPLLAGISKTNVYTVPEGFFSEQSIAAPQVAEKAPSKVIDMRPKRSWLAYAAAACVVFILGTIGIRYYNQNQDEYAVTAKQQSKYTSTVALNVQAAINNLSDEEINSYLDKQNSNAIDVSMPAGTETIDVDGLIQDISDKEIEDYLKHNSYPADNDVSGI